METPCLHNACMSTALVTLPRGLYDQQCLRSMSYRIPGRESATHSILSMLLQIQQSNDYVTHVALATGISDEVVQRCRDYGWLVSSLDVQDPFAETRVLQ
jgi:hypothetical protein